MKYLTKVKQLILQNIDLTLMFLFCVLLIVVNIRMNIFSYNNFDFGKFDLGNMSQMLWNTLHGRFMYLTDYFGTNVPRWAMSHVDPILILFLPIFILFQNPLTLVFSQIILVVFSCFLVYAIARLELKSRWQAFFIGMSFLFYPALGYLTAKTGFHGVSVAIPFFLANFYVLEKMFYEKNYSKKYWLWFWVLAVITISGKEELALYTFFLGLFAYLYRSDEFKNKVMVKNAVILMIVSFVWFILAFFVIIPAFGKLRADGYSKFANSLGIDPSSARAVDLPNYFLSRYDAFGESYTDIIKNIIIKPDLAVTTIFGGDKMDNLSKTFSPVLLLPLAAPQIMVFAVPDLMMNYLTSASGTGTSEITNHRISMVIPVIFISTIFAIKLLNDIIKKLFAKNPKISRYLVFIPGILLLSANVYTTFQYNNPVYLWMRDAIVKRFPIFTVEAKTDTVLSHLQSLKIGDVYKISPLENKDRECAQKIISIIPSSASISGPDYLGAQLSLRETYAIFPALYDQADYVIIDVFSKKILTILDLQTGLINDVVNKVISDPNYDLEESCGNLFVFKRVPGHTVNSLLPIQERYRYPEKYNFPILSGLTLVDYTLPASAKRGEHAELKYVYAKRDRLDEYFLFTTFINKDTNEIYQAANLPSFAISEPQDWKIDYYYLESVDIALPTYLKAGDYRVLVGMTNEIKTRSIYLGDIKVE